MDGAGLRRNDPLHASDIATSSSTCTGLRPPAPPAPMRARIAQRDEQFVPPVTAVTVGSAVEFPNEDPFFHNVFSLSKAANFDLGRYPSGVSRTRHFAKPGIVKVFCHLHAQMTALIMVLDHPWFTIPADDGTFTLPQVPAGELTVVAWHERIGERRERRAGDAGRTTKVSFTLPVLEPTAVSPRCRARQPPRLVVRALLASFLTVALILGAVFVLLTHRGAPARASVGRGESGCRAAGVRASREPPRAGHDCRRCPRSPRTRRSKPRSTPGRLERRAGGGSLGECVRTVQNEVKKIGDRVGADVLAIVDARGEVVASAGPRAAAFAAGHGDARRPTTDRPAAMPWWSWAGMSSGDERPAVPARGARSDRCELGTALLTTAMRASSRRWRARTARS